MFCIYGDSGVIRFGRLGLLGVFVIVLLGMGGGVGDAASGGGSPSLPFPVTDGEVTSSAVAGSTLYLGGSFSRVGAATGTFASISAGSAQAAVLPHVNDPVYEVVSDRRGGWFISGVFTAAGDSTRPGLAHIDPNGTLDPGFDPAVSQPHALAVSPDGSTLYLNCDSQVGGASYIDAIDTATGVIRGHFRASDNIHQLVVSPDGKTLYAGGIFGKGPGVEEISATTGKDLRWLAGSGRTTFSIALSSDGKTVYDIHGDGGVNGGTKWSGHLTAWSTVSSQRKWQRAVKADDQPISLAISGDGRTLYMGGAFTTINTTARAHLAAFRTTNGSLTPFNVGTAGNVLGSHRNDDGVVYALAVAKTTLYVGGVFTSLGGIPRYGLGAIDTATSTVTGWDPAPNSLVDALAISGDGNSVGAGGAFNAMASITRDHLAAIDLNTDSVTSFAPDFGNGSAVDSMVLSPDHATLYVGGSFGTVDGAARNGIAAFSTATGTLISFNPAGAGLAHALAVSPDGATLYAAEDQHLLAISTSTGATIWSVPAGNWWDTSLAVSPDGSALYVSQINATPALRALATSTGDPVPGFNPPPVDTGGTGALVVSPDGSTVYSGDVGFDTATGTPTFEPSVDGAVKATALSADGNDFFIGGTLKSVDGVARNGVAEIDLANGGQVTSLDPQITGVGNGIEMLAAHGSTLVIGGDFSLAGQGHLNLARFAIP